MSQEKVDKYKQEKANRRKEVAKKKRQKKLYTFFGILLGIAFVAWLVVSVFLEIKQGKEDAAAQSSFQAMLDEYFATYTSGGATTGTGDATTGTDDVTTGTGDATTGTGNDSTSDSETTSAADKSENTEEETTTKAS